MRILVGIGFGCFALATLVGWIIARLTNAVLINDNPLSLGALLGVGLAILCFGAALIGAVVRLAQLRQWGWFAALLVFIAFVFPLGVLAFVLYLVIGPDTPAALPTPQRTE